MVEASLSDTQLGQHRHESSILIWELRCSGSGSGSGSGHWSWSCHWDRSCHRDWSWSGSWRLSKYNRVLRLLLRLSPISSGVCEWILKLDMNI